MLSVFILIALVKFLQVSDSPKATAIFYGIIVFVTSFSVWGALISLVLGFIYFTLLKNFENSNLFWWSTLIIGAIVIGLV